MTRGFIFSGPPGLGKTTVAYLFAKLAMCMSADPFHCPGCPSCDLFVYDDGGYLNHPNFTEVDAASHSGVDHSREIIQTAEQPPQGSRRRVILLDEAHRLSRPAWDVYLKPLEVPNTDALFIFSTNEPENIPGTIESRCTCLPFKLVLRDDLLGMLMGIADREQLPYTFDGLQRIAYLAHGKPRVAIKLFQTVALVGTVNPDNCETAITEDILRSAAQVMDLLAASAKGRSEECVEKALRIADEVAQVSGPSPLANALFEAFSTAFCENSLIAHTFNNHRGVTATFIKWTKAQQIPVDAIPLLLMELLEFLPGKTTVMSAPEQRSGLIRKARAAKPGPDNQQTTTSTEEDGLSLDAFERMAGDY